MPAGRMPAREKTALHKGDRGRRYALQFTIVRGSIFGTRTGIGRDQADISIVGVKFPAGVSGDTFQPDPDSIAAHHPAEPDCQTLDIAR